MGYQLWMSPQTGYRRQGTRFDSLHHIFLENAKLYTLFEPVLCCKSSDDACNAKAALEFRDFDVTCVIDEQGNIIGQIEKNALKEGFVYEYVKNISDDDVVDENTSLVKILSILKNSNFKYVTRNNKVIGIVTRSDLNKPIPRTYLFGVISLVELHLNFWINHYHLDDSWLYMLSSNRKARVYEIIKLRHGSEKYLAMIDCAQLCDKKEILRNTSDFLKQFKFSKANFKKFLENLEKMRNYIAHSQSSIIEQLDWEIMANTISTAENFIIMSDDLVEKQGNEKSKDYEQSILIAVHVPHHELYNDIKKNS